MKSSANHQTEPTRLPIKSCHQGWENILVEQFQHPPGEASCHYSDEHAICLSLAPHPVRLLQIKGGKTYAALHGKGDISITPTKGNNGSSAKRKHCRLVVVTVLR